MKTMAFTLPFLLIFPAASLAQDIQITVGSEYIEGKYEYETTTWQNSHFATVKWVRDTWSVKASISHLHSEGPAGVNDESGRNTPSSQTTQRYQGWGDLSLTLTKELEWESAARKGLFFDLSASSRLSTAESTSGISDHDPDYTLMLDSFAIQKQWLYMASVGYRWNGTRDYSQISNQILVSTGIQYSGYQTCKPGLLLDYRQSSYSGTASARELMAYSTCPLNPNWSVMPYLLTGFSDNSPDLGAGLQLSWKP